MKLTSQQSYALLEKFGAYIKEICDRCGRGIGPICYTRKGEPGVSCSWECRDGKEAHAPGTCHGCGASLVGLRRGAKFCSDVCRMRSVRKNGKSQTGEIIPNEKLKTKGLQTQLGVSAITTHPAAVEAPERGLAQR
jgi:hypothetical protein